MSLICVNFQLSVGYSLGNEQKEMGNTGLMTKNEISDLCLEVRRVWMLDIKRKDNVDYFPQWKKCEVKIHLAQNSTWMWGGQVRKWSPWESPLGDSMILWGY